MFKKNYSGKDFKKLAEGMKTAYEQRIRQLEDRIERLNVENRNLRAACAEYQAKEKNVGKAIIDAEQKGDEIRELYRLNAECELRTLQMFAEKWKRLAAQMAEYMPVGEGEKYIEFADNLAALLGKESASFFENYNDAAKTSVSVTTQSVTASDKSDKMPPRNSKTGRFEPRKKIEEYVDEQKQTIADTVGEETEFNLDDVLNPKHELNLEKLCRELGLMDE